MKLLKYILYLIQIFAPLDGEIKTFKRLFQNSWYYIKKYLFFFLLAYLIKLYWGRNPTKLLQHSKILPVPLQVKSYVDSIG